MNKSCNRQCRAASFMNLVLHLDFQQFSPEAYVHTVHPDTTNAEWSSKRGYKQLYRGNTQGKKT